MSGDSGEGDEGFGVFRLFSVYPTLYSRRTRGEGTNTTGHPYRLLDFLYPNAFPREKRKKIEDRYEKDDFDNGYSANISEITTNNDIDCQQKSQLIEKTSIRSGSLIDSIWLKNQRKSKSENEEEIYNVFRNEDEEDLEVDGESSNQGRLTLCPDCVSGDCPVSKMCSLMMNSQTSVELKSENYRKKKKRFDALEEKSQSTAKETDTFSQVHSTVSAMKHETNSSSSNSNAYERTPDTSLAEMTEQSGNGDSNNDKNSSQIKESDTNQDQINDILAQPLPSITGNRVVEEETNESNGTLSMTNSSSEEENNSKDDSDKAKEDHFDEIDEILPDEDEYEELNRYTFNDILPGNIPALMKKAFGNGSDARKEGRYSRGIDQFVNMPTFMESIRKFATDNGFELEDVIPDGNCMFRAVVDQLNVNGDLGHTPQSLRLKAVRYLRQNPCQSDGSKLEAFLSTETWEHYLLRMEQNSQWGDHMILKAIADALNLIVVVFNVFEDDVRRTEILPEGTPITKRQRLTIYLGHIGEFHYLSLRQLDWEIVWPFKSLIRRLQVFLKVPKFSAKNVFQEKIANMGISKYLKNAGLMMQSNAENSEETINAVGLKDQLIDLQPEQSKTFVRYGLPTLQMEETIESLNSLLEDSLGIDALTGLPLPHFSFVIKRLIDIEMMTLVVFEYKQSIPNEYKKGDRWFKFETFGSSAEGVNVCMKDSSKERKMQFFEEVKRFNTPSFLFCNMNVEVIFPGDSNKDASKMVLYASSRDTHIGYCRLIPGFPLNRSWNNVLFQGDNEVYIQKNPIPSDLKESFPGIDIRKLVIGYRSSFFPSAARKWQSRQRKHQWPPEAIIEEIISGGCLLIPVAHPKSKMPDVEWKFLFSNAVQILIKKAFNTNQTKVFKLFKVVIEYLTRHLEKTLRHKHLIHIFLNASEQISLESWEKNIGGCLLFVVGYLLHCLQNRNIPHYFIPENNIIDYFSETEIQTISTYIEAFRVLPIQCLENIYNRHGWKHVLKKGLGVLKDSKHFCDTRDIIHAWINVFHPISIQVATVVADLGLHDLAYLMICKVYDDLKQSPLPERPCFEIVFQDAMKYVKVASAREALMKLYDEKRGRNVTNNDGKRDVNDANNDGKRGGNVANNDGKRGGNDVNNDGKRGGNFANINQKSRNIQPMHISEAMPFNVDERIRDFIIPETHSKVQESIIKWIDSKAMEYFMIGNFEIAEVFLQTDIKYIKHLLQEQNDFDVSEIEDKNLRSEIGQQRTERITSLIQDLFFEYDALYTVCTGIGSIHPFDEHLADLEEFQHSVEGADKLLALVKGFSSELRSSFHFPGLRNFSI